MNLTEQLNAIRAGAEKNIPAPTLELMHRATKELNESDILMGVIKPGVSLPAFELPNQNDVSVSSADLLAKGPMIITVYRGLW